MTTNKRTKGERIPVELLVDYNSDGNYLFDFCKDLGAGGIFIASTKPKEVGEVIELTFTLPDSKETLKLKGKVMWSQKPSNKDSNSGMGVQFTDYNPEARLSLEDFVKRYSTAEKAV